MEAETGDLEDNIEEKESRLSHLTSEYENLEKTTEENKRAHTELSNRGKNDLSQQTKLENELEELLRNIEINEDKYVQVS